MGEGGKGEKEGRGRRREGEKEERRRRREGAERVVAEGQERNEEGRKKRKKEREAEYGERMIWKVKKRGRGVEGERRTMGKDRKR